MAALQYVDVPGYAAILFRRTFRDLALPGALMDRAREWLSGTDARWNEIDLENETALDDAGDLGCAEPLDDAAELDEVQAIDSAPSGDGEAAKDAGDAMPQTNGDALGTLAPTSALIATHAAQPTAETDAGKHFQAIEAALTLAEKMRAHELATQRPVAELRAWYADLLRRSVPDAVAKIRAELAASDSNPTTTKKGGVS